MNFKQKTKMLDSQPLANALWWFIEEVGEDDPDRSQLFFHLRQRVRLSTESEESLKIAASMALTSLKDLSNGWQGRELHEPVSTTIERLEKLL